MSKVYLLGGGVTKAVAQDAPLNNEILGTALLASSYDEICEEFEETKTFLKKIFVERPKLVGSLSISKT